MGCLFTCFIMSFDAQNFTFCCSPIYVFFVLLFMFLLSYLQNQSHGNLYSSSKNSIVLALMFMFKTLVHFKLIFTYGVKLVN